MKKALKVIGGSILAIIAIALMITGGAETIIEDVVELFFDLLDIVGEHKEKSWRAQGKSWRVQGKQKLRLVIVHAIKM